jgi:enoyl-CoA hydratase
MYLALTGERVKRADAVMLGLATHAATSEGIEALRQALMAGEPVEQALSRASADPGPAPLSAERAVIDSCFAADSVSAILQCLDEAAAQGSDFAARTAEGMRTKSPTSMSIAFEQVRRGASLDFEEAMKVEYRIVSRIPEGQDFYEGVRAVLIDKDNQPHWKPASLEALGKADIDRYFADLGEHELELA